MANLEPGSASDSIFLREVMESDLPLFFEFQLDPAANRMAAFAAKDPGDRDAFDAHWARGIATEALELFLHMIENRPIYARAAKDNVGSIQVLEKCGFEIEGKDKGFANARGEEIEELVLKLG